MFANRESVPPFLVIDLRRFDWPKDESWDSTSYATGLVKHPNAVERVIDLYPPLSTLSKMQREFELEDDGPEIETVADSLGAAHLSDYHKEDRETFNFLLADL
jgi:hypothetical protein